MEINYSFLHCWIHTHTHTHKPININQYEPRKAMNKEKLEITAALALSKSETLNDQRDSWQQGQGNPAGAKTSFTKWTQNFISMK